MKLACIYQQKSLGISNKIASIFSPKCLQLILIFALISTTVTSLPTILSQIMADNPQTWDSKEPTLVVNQIGYKPHSYKLALLLNAENEPANNVELVNVQTDKVVSSISPSPPQVDSLSQDTLQVVNFTSFDNLGEYYLRYGNLRSVPFGIGNDIYQKPLFTLTRSYYLQRCGVVLNDPVTGIYHPPCHLHDGIVAHSDPFHQGGKPINTQGGWHDAGDYGKYVSTTAVTIGRLLSLYENNPQVFTDNQLQIPESGDGMPDLLDEIQGGLAWLLAMQRPDGAVYRKLSGTEWPFNLSPDEDAQPRYVYGIATTETAKFAAAMAMAARVYTPWQPALANMYRQAALNSWQFLEENPELRVDWVDGDDAGSGHYLFTQIEQEESFKSDLSDRFWAAAELLITTKEAKFESYFSSHLDDFEYTLFEWKDPSALGMIDYLLQDESKVSENLAGKIKDKLLTKADSLLIQSKNNSYGVANQRFVWGSNKLISEDGITLVYAYQITNNPEYLQVAQTQLDYLLGRNHFNQTFVTGVGTNPVRNVNHLFARAKRIAIPGLLVGGANQYAEDGIAPKNNSLLSYVDDEHSYATNEYAIDYNASLISLMVMLAEINIK